MSGQSASLSISEAKTMMKRTEASSMKPGSSQGPKGSSGDVMTKCDSQMGKK